MLLLLLLSCIDVYVEYVDIACGFELKRAEVSRHRKDLSHIMNDISESMILTECTPPQAQPEHVMH